MVEQNEPWTEFYRPENLGQVVGNEDAIILLRKWFDSWSPNTKRKAALLHGPAGIGKTSSVVALAKERGFELVEMNASDSRNKKAILQIAGSSAKEGTLTTGSRGKRILLIDEVDGITGREDRGGVGTLVKVIKDSSVPIICTANDAYKSKLSPLRKVSKVIAYQPVHPEYIVKVLKRISRAEKLALEDEHFKFLAENANGDMRSAINDLQGMVLQMQNKKLDTMELLKPYRDQTKDVQKALSDLFNAGDFTTGKRSINGVKAKYDEVLLWIFENAYKHTSQEQLVDVYETIAHADRFLGRIRRRQSWNLLSYFFDLVSGGVAVQVDKPTRKYDKYTYPQKIAMYARTRFSRAIRDSISRVIAEKTHVSTHVARNELLYLVKEIMNSNIGDAANLAYWLELDNNQIKKLVDSKTNLSKIKKVIKALEDEQTKQQTKMGDLKYSSFDQEGDDWSEVLEEWEKKKEQLLEEEKRQKEEEKKRKAAARKAKKKKAAEAKKKAKKKETIEEDKDKNQASLDQFFN